MSWTLSRKPHAGPDDPYRIVDTESGKTLADPDNPEAALSVPASAVNGLATQLAAKAAPPGSPAWLANLDPTATAVFDTLKAAGASDADAAQVAGLPDGATRTWAAGMLTDRLAAEKGRAKAEQTAREDGWRSAMATFRDSPEAKARLTPAAHAGFESTFLALAEMDHASPLPAAEDGQPATPRVESFKAMVKGLPAHAFTGERTIPKNLPPGAHALSNDESVAAKAGGNGSGMTMERRRELLSKTPEGRQALKRMDASGNARAGASGHGGNGNGNGNA